MKKRLPAVMEGRDVRLTRILETEGIDDMTIKEAWKIIMSRVGDGEWYSICRKVRMGKIIKLYNGLENRSYMSGYTKEILTIRKTELDGICFHWTWEGEKNPGIPAMREQRRLAKNEDVRRQGKARRARTRKVREGRK